MDSKVHARTEKKKKKNLPFAFLFEVLGIKPRILHTLKVSAPPTSFTQALDANYKNQIINTYSALWEDLTRKKMFSVADIKVIDTSFSFDMESSYIAQTSLQNTRIIDVCPHTWKEVTSWPS